MSRPTDSEVPEAPRRCPGTNLAPCGVGQEDGEVALFALQTWPSSSSGSSGESSRTFGVGTTGGRTSRCRASRRTAAFHEGRHIWGCSSPNKRNEVAVNLNSLSCRARGICAHPTIDPTSPSERVAARRSLWPTTESGHGLTCPDATPMGRRAKL